MKVEKKKKKKKKKEHEDSYNNTACYNGIEIVTHKAVIKLLPIAIFYHTIHSFIVWRSLLSLMRVVGVILVVRRRLRGGVTGGPIVIQTATVGVYILSHRVHII